MGRIWVAFNFLRKWFLCTRWTLLVVWFWNKAAFLNLSLITAWSCDWGFPYDRCRGHTCSSALILTLISLTSWFTFPGLAVICKMEVNRISLSALEGWLAPVLVRVLQTKRHTEKESCLLWGIGSQVYGTWQVPKSAGWVGEVETPREPMVYFQSKSKGLRTKRADCVLVVQRWTGSRFRKSQCIRVWKQKKSWCHTLKAKRIHYLLLREGFTFLFCSNVQ